MKAGLWDYIREAFSARPIGMLVAPNWIGLGVFAVLGLVSPGFLLLGAGLELAYLFVLVSHPRFQRLVDAQRLVETQRQWQSKLEKAVSALDRDDVARYRALEARCRSILLQQSSSNPGILKAQSEGLGRLLWIYVKLLFTRQSIRRVLRESGAGPDEKGSPQGRIKEIQARLADKNIPDDLRKSLSGQMEILQQRQAKRQEAADKLAFLEAELDRIQQQAELIREQAVLSTDPETVSQRIDDISATLGGTTTWINEQSQLYGKVEDLLEEPPGLAVPAATEKTP